MNPTDPRRKAALDAGMDQIRTTAATVATRVAESLNAVAAATARISDRDTIIATPQELRRTVRTFQNVLHEALRAKVRDELEPRRDARTTLATADWPHPRPFEDRRAEAPPTLPSLAPLSPHPCP